MVEPYVGDMRFDRCILLADNSPDVFHSPSLPREWRKPGRLFARLSQRCLWLAIRSGAPSAARVYPRATAAATSSSRIGMQQQQGLLAKCRRLTWPMLTWSMLTRPYVAVCRRLTQTDVASCCRHLRISTTIRPAVESQLHKNNQGSTVNKAS